MENITTYQTNLKFNKTLKKTEIEFIKAMEQIITLAIEKDMILPFMKMLGEMSFKESEKVRKKAEKLREQLEGKDSE